MILAGLRIWPQYTYSSKSEHVFIKKLRLIPQLAMYFYFNLLR
jgi:hypothetical protein